MTGMHSLGSGLSVLGTLFQLAIVIEMDPTRWSGWRSCPFDRPGQDGYLPSPRFIRIWAPHFENVGEGRPASLGPRCPGRQQASTPFRIADAPLPRDYDPHAYPNADVIACVWLDGDGAVAKARIEGGTGSVALDRRLLRNLYRQWRFVPANDSGADPGWQRIRLNSAQRSAPLPEPPAMLPL